MKLTLWGDSQVCRMKNFLETSHNQYGIQLNNCLAKSGITISQLKRIIKQEKPVMHADTVYLIFIATNDIKLKRNYTQIKKDYLSLMATVRRFNVSQAQIILVSIPAFPKYHHYPEILHTIHRFNKLISSISTQQIHYTDWDWEHSSNLYFEQTIGKHARIDRLHLNQAGFQYLLSQVDVLQLHKQLGEADKTVLRRK